jgi:hypothetical protein
MAALHKERDALTLAVPEYYTVEWVEEASPGEYIYALRDLDDRLTFMSEKEVEEYKQ